VQLTLVARQLPGGSSAGTPTGRSERPVQPEYLRPGPDPAPATPSGAILLQPTWHSISGALARGMITPMLSRSGQHGVVQLLAGVTGDAAICFCKALQIGRWVSAGRKNEDDGSMRCRGREDVLQHPRRRRHKIWPQHRLHIPAAFRRQRLFTEHLQAALEPLLLSLSWTARRVGGSSMLCLWVNAEAAWVLKRNAHGCIPAEGRTHLDDEQVLKGSQLFAPAARHLSLHCVSSPGPPGSAVCRKARRETSKGGHAAFEGRG